MKMKLYQYLIPILMAFGIGHATAQTAFFSPVDANARAGQPVTKKISRLSLYHLKTGDLRSYLLGAALEFKSKSPQGLALEIPLPDGSLETFSLFESPILSPQVAARHPEIKTYAGKGSIHEGYSVRINFKSAGFNAIILEVENDVVLELAQPGDIRTGRDIQSS